MVYKAIVDPTGHYEESILDYYEDKSSLYGYLVEACGFVPQWVMTAVEEGDGFMKMKEKLDKLYGFGLFEMKGGEVKEDGTYLYPGDPPLYPLIKMVFMEKEVVYQYEHGIVCIIEEGAEPFVTRMD